jgi:hypothetical protein
MIFQVLLVIALCILAVYAYFQRRNAPLIAVLVFALTLCGLALAVAPNIANDLAHFVGIGRGADLIVYCFILISLAAIFNLHLRFRLNEERLTRLVRALALLTPQQSGASPHGNTAARLTDD